MLGVEDQAACGDLGVGYSSSSRAVTTPEASASSANGPEEVGLVVGIRAYELAVAVTSSAAVTLFAVSL